MSQWEFAVCTDTFPKFQQIVFILHNYAYHAISMYAFRIVFRRVLYDALEWKRTKSKQKQPNQLIILSFIKAISGLCCSVQTTVDHFLFRSAAVLPDFLCTNISK